jgi:PII-like signaling protein
MELNSESRLLRVFLGEDDKIGHQLLYEAILLAARKQGMAGCTVLRGIMSFGASSVVHTAKFIDISEDLPIVVEIVDLEDRINSFTGTVSALMEEAGKGGLITVERANVLYYKDRRKK